MIKKRFLHYYILTAIIFLGLFLRLYNLNNDPAGFFCDEASIGYNAYTIAHTGKDQYGISFPFFFQAFGEYKSPVQIYSTAPFIFFFGLNEWTTRLPSAIYGTISILAIYLFVMELFHISRYKRYIALYAALLLSISPWDIHFSRVAFELMPFVCFTLLGSWAFLVARHKPMFYFTAVLFFILALYSYSSARLFIPFFVILLCLLYYRFLLTHLRTVILAFLLGIILLLPLGLAVKNGIIFARFDQISVFTHHPQGESISKHITDNYLSSLSPDFLFFKGDSGMPGQFITRHSIKGMGELYLWQMLFVFLGLAFLIIKRQWKIFAILLTWILLYPAGSMLTTDQSAQATRDIIGVIPWQILTAVSLTYSVVYIRHKILKFSFIICCLLVILFSFIQYTQQYFIVYPTYSSDFWGWQMGARDVIHYFQANENKYDQLVMAPEFNAPEIFFSFYAPTDCTKCIVGTPDTVYNPKTKQLFAVTSIYLQQHPIYHFKTLQTVSFPNQTIAFMIGKIVE